MERSGETQAPFNVLSDTYSVFVPIEDTDLLKSVEVDENGDWIVQGVMSSDDTDEEDDSITPDGMDCSYFLTKGWVKYEHGNNPNQFIGEPLEVKVGRFEHPTLRKSVNGIFVKARLFQQRELAKQAVRTIEDLQKSQTKRRMGWSIEGNVKERCRTTGKILKSVLRNVVLTMNPVNTMTFAELKKSFAANHSIENGMVDKSLDTGGMAEVTPQSVEGGTKPVDAEEWVSKLFRKYVKRHMKKKLRKSFVDSDPATAGITAYQFGRREGLGYDDALEFASSVSERFDALKSLFVKIGGEQMSEQAKKKVADLLDSDLEELQKSLEMDDEELEGDEELNKSVDPDNDDDDDTSEDGDNDDDDGAGADDEDGDNDDDENGDKEEMKKSLKTDFAKSFGDKEENADALEVSDFLANFVEEVGFHFDGFNKSLTHVTKQQNATVQALVSVGELVKSLATELKEVKADNAELQKSLGDLLQRPVGRKSVTSQREVQTITKSMGAAGGEQPRLTRGKVLEVLQKSFDAGNMAVGTEIARYEAGVPLQELRLNTELKQQLGL